MTYTKETHSYFLIDIPCHPDFIESSFTLNNVENDPKDVVENVLETNTTLSAYFHVTERTIQPTPKVGKSEIICTFVTENE